MPKFRYQVRSTSGGSNSGVLTASDVGEAGHILRKDGNTIVAITEDIQTSSVTIATAKKKISRDDMIQFVSQLAIMVDTGVTLAEALDAIADGTDNLGMRVIAEKLSAEVKGGKEFSAALEEHPRIFGKLFVSLMRASEATGTMGAMLTRLSTYLEHEQEIRKKVKGAMVYPICMLSFCVLVVVGLLIFILPRFEKIYSSKSAVLPLPTRMLLGVSNGLISYWPLVLTGVAATVVALSYYLRSKHGQIATDRFRISVPILGSMYRKAYLARSLRSLATMVAGGVNILDGLTITAQVAGNRFYRKVWMDLADRVREGSTLAEPLAACPLVPASISRMVAAGERTGRLSEVMDRAAGFCERDLKTAVKAVTDLVEPAMIIIMGLIIGSIALALLLPIFSLSKVVGN